MRPWCAPPTLWPCPRSRPISLSRRLPLQSLTIALMCGQTARVLSAGGVTGGCRGCRGASAWTCCPSVAHCSRSASHDNVRSRSRLRVSCACGCPRPAPPPAIPAEQGGAAECESGQGLGLRAARLGDVKEGTCPRRGHEGEGNYWCCAWSSRLSLRPGRHFALGSRSRLVEALAV